MTRRLEVIGGAGGLDVEYDDLAAIAHLLQTAALDLVDTAFSARAVLNDTGLLASAVLDPGGFARVEAAVLSAVLGPHGLVPTAGRLEGRSGDLRAAVLRYQAADDLGAGLRDIRHWVEGATAVGVAMVLLPVLAAAPLLPPAQEWLRGGQASGFLAAHPGIAEDAAGSAPAFLDTVLTLGLGPLAIGADVLASRRIGRPVLGTSLEDASSLVGLFYQPGSAVVLGRGNDPSAPPAPRGVGDLLAALDYRDSRSAGDAQGEIDVRRLTRVGPTGTVMTSWVVDLPGTKEWQFDPRHREHLNDLATNLTTMAGEPSARVEGVTRALQLAGVNADEPVMLVGHSQGGLVAMRAAEQYVRDGSFRVTHVVTAGSPTARMDVPPSVTVLSLENRYDLVPQLDGEPPPPDANRVTVVFDAQSHDVGANHATATTYLPAARQVDADLRDPSLAAWREGASDFLSPTHIPVDVRTTVWDIRNGG